MNIDIKTTNTGHKRLKDITPGDWFVFPASPDDWHILASRSKGLLRSTINVTTGEYRFYHRLTHIIPASTITIKAELTITY